MIHPTIAELVNEKGWTLDQALHEVVHMRSDLATLLQARPRAPKAILPVNPGYKGGKGDFRLDAKGAGKGAGKSGNGKSKGSKNRVEWITELMVNGNKQQLCMRYQVEPLTD